MATKPKAQRSKAKAQRTKLPGKPEKPPIPGKSKPAKAETIAKVKNASGGKYKNDAEVRAVVAKVEATTDPMATVFENLGIKP